MIKEAIVKIVNKEDLTYDEAYTVMNEIMSGETTPTQNAAFLAALSTKSAKAETTDEIAGCAKAMRDHAIPVDTGMDVLEIGPLPTPAVAHLVRSMGDAYSKMIPAEDKFKGIGAYAAKRAIKIVRKKGAKSGK